MSGISYTDVIPNNIHLSHNKQLQRALSRWQPAFHSWWNEVGPQVFNKHEVYLRTAISTEPGGWANFSHVRLADYRWGIFLSAPEPDRTIPAGDDAGRPVWQQVPGEHRHALQRLIVIQGDTEPASVEQQRWLAATCPSLYDCRNLFQVNVEEARHLWAMVYLLHAYFGRDGRNEADALLERRAGDADHPRLLNVFNEPCSDWLSFFCYTAFADRDGKYQLGALAESAFDPLSRSCRFMLTEEAHHLFIGESGLNRIARRSAQLMKEDPNGDTTQNGGIPLAMIQRFINRWFSLCLDLFGSEISSNAASNFAAGLKGRWGEARSYTDHLATDPKINIPQIVEDKFIPSSVPMRLAMNELLRAEYVIDCRRVIKRLNKMLQDEDIHFEFSLPHTRFHRRQGLYSTHHFDIDGNLISKEQWESQKHECLPTESDAAYINNLMATPVTEPGAMAHWIAPPRNKINRRPHDFAFVRTEA